MISTAVRTGLSRQPCAVVHRLTTVATASATKSRAVGAKCRFLTTKTPQKPPTPALKRLKKAVTSNPTSNTNSPPMSSDMSNPPDVTVEVTPEMKMANVVLATLLAGFVGGIFYFSMMSVGSQEKDSEDPLAMLKQEAQEAMDRQEKELTPDDKAKQLLQEFSRGEHDPDKQELDALEELEKLDEEDAKKNKKSWWKFWKKKN